MRAFKHGAKTDAERKCLEAVYAYERTLSDNRGKRIRASRTWQLISKYGIIGAVERAVNRKAETSGYRALLAAGLEEYAFEAVVICYPELFSQEAVEISKARINEHT